MTNRTQFELLSHLVDKLKRAGDWAGLVCNWMAFQNSLALDEAINLAQERVNSIYKKPGFFSKLFQRSSCDPGRWRALVDILKNQKGDGNETCSDWELFQWSETEQITFTLLSFYSNAFLCETARRAQRNKQEELFAIGLLGAEMGYLFAKKMDDKALHAIFLSLIARGNQNLSELEKHGHTLKGHNSPVNRAHVKEALESIGLLGVMNELQIAKVCYTKALELYCDIESKQPGICTSTIAERRNNLGWVELDLNHPKAAGANFVEALRIYKDLNELYPGKFQECVGATLRNLDSVS